MGSGSWAKEVHSGVDQREALTLLQPVSREAGARAKAASVMRGRQIKMMPAQVPRSWLSADCGLAALDTGLHHPAQQGGSQGLPRP